MRPYFEKMPRFGKELRENRIARTKESRAKLENVEAEIAAARNARQDAGIPAAKINERGMLTVWQRLEYLVDEGTWHPLHSLYNPADNPEGATNVVDGLGKIAGRWAVIIGFDNKVLAGAWVPGQSENILRVTDIAKRLHIPLVWLVNCSGAQLPEQEKFYANRRGSGTCFYRHAELEQMGIPILAGIYGTNPAGGGYQSISPTILLAHKDANIAVGGVGIVSGMAPKGGFDAEGLEELIAKTRDFRARPPGRVETHYGETGFFTQVFDEEKQVLDGIKQYMRAIPAYEPMFFRVAEPAEPALPANDIYHLLPFNQKEAYIFDEILARLVDGSEHMEFRPDYGPEIYTGLVKIDGMLIGADRQPAGAAAQGLSGIRRLPRHRRQALPPGPDQDERIRQPVRPRPSADHLVSGHDRHRRGRSRREGGTARARPIADLFDPADRRPDDAGGPAQGQRGGPLRHGRPDRQPP